MNTPSRTLAISALFLVSCSTLPQAQNAPPQPDSTQAKSDTDAQVAQAAQMLVKKHEAFRSQITSLGVLIEARESARDANKVSYKLYVKGLPADKLYTIVSWPVTKKEPFSAFKGVSIAQDGLVSCTGKLPGECSDPSAEDHGAVKFTFTPVKGEPFRIALINGDSKAAIVIVPDPISAEDKGCRLEAVRLLPHFELAYLSGAGFTPNTEVTFNSESYGEKHTSNVQADADGKIRFAIMPFVAGHTNGTTTISANSNTCSPALQFDWGAPAIPSAGPATGAVGENLPRPVN